jgi:hypothetical protein
MLEKNTITRETRRLTKLPGRLEAIYITVRAEKWVADFLLHLQLLSGPALLLTHAALKS